MTINTGEYCLVSTAGPDEVLQGPKLLPPNWVGTDGATYTNINNSDVWSDQMLIGIGWYPYRVIDNGPPNPEPQKYNRGLDDFVIAATEVTRTAVYTEWTQEQYDLDADTTLTNSQQIASDLASQTEQILQQNSYRNDNGKNPIIPPNDLADVNAYLGDLYDAMDDSNVMPKEPPGSIRQVTTVPGEEVSRATVRRTIVDWAGQDYTRLTYVLYPGQVNPTGMSFKVHLADNTYLSTYNLVDQGDGSWKAETNIIGAFQGTTVDLKYVLFKGVDISQMRDFLHTDDDQIFDVRWLDGVLGQRIQEGTI